MTGPEAGSEIGNDASKFSVASKDQPEGAAAVETESLPTDPFLAEVAKLEARINRSMHPEKYPQQPGEELSPVVMYDPGKAAVVNVDNFQPTFAIKDEKNPLALDSGMQMVIRSLVYDQERDPWGLQLETIDYHNENNIGNADVFGLPPFSKLFLSGQEVMVHLNDGSAEGIDKPYDEVVKKNAAGGEPVFNKEQVKAYLEKQKRFRIFTAALLRTANLTDDNKVSVAAECGQMLWPLHATDKTTELAHLTDPKVEKKFKPDIVVIKGGGINAATDPKANGTDSYGGVFAGDGTEVMMTKNNGFSDEMDTQPVGAKLAEELNKKRLKQLIVRGLAFSHCVLNNAENFGLMRALGAMNQEFGADAAKIKQALQEKLAKVTEAAHTEAEVEEMYQELYLPYVQHGLMLDPNIEIAVIASESDTVRGLNFSTHDAQAQFAAYEAIGVKLISSQQIKLKADSKNSY